MARIAVVGVDAVGGAPAGFLETAGGHRIALCTRRPMPELTVKTPAGTLRVKARNLAAARAGAGCGLGAGGHQGL